MQTYTSEARGSPPGHLEGPEPQPRPRSLTAASERTLNPRACHVHSDTDHSSVSSHKFKAQHFTVGVSNLRIMAHANLSTPFSTRSFQGLGPSFQLDNSITDRRRLANLVPARHTALRELPAFRNQLEGASFPESGQPMVSYGYPEHRSEQPNWPDPRRQSQSAGRPSPAWRPVREARARAVRAAAAVRAVPRASPVSDTAAARQLPRDGQGPLELAPGAVYHCE